MGRLSDWSDRLIQHIEDWRHKKFEWGKSDCALFCLYAEKAMCGASRFDDFLGQYSSAKGSLKALCQYGQRNLSDTVSDRLPEVDLLKAQRGDIALVDTPTGDALSLVIGNKLAAMGENGLVFLPLNAAKKTWRV